MAKKKKKNKALGAKTNVSAGSKPVKSEVPKFEIGVKGDEFDIKYTRAAQKEHNRAEALFKSIFRESSRTISDLVCFAVLALMMIFMSLSFAFLSREEAAPKFSVEKLYDGSYLESLRKYYSDSLPLGDKLHLLGATIGLYDAKSSEIDEKEPPTVTRPIPQDTTTFTEPVTTTAPPETTVPTTAATETEPTTTQEPPETFRMYANSTANIRLRPDSDSMIMGYFYKNERVDVIEIGDDGWASIWYGGAVLYIHSDYLSRHRTAVTAEAVTTEEVSETELETEPDETTPEEATEETFWTDPTEPSELTEPVVTTETRTTRIMDPDVSAFISWANRHSTQAEQESLPTETYSPPLETSD